MSRSAFLPITADRYTPCIRTFIFRGIDLTGAGMQLSIRLQPDTPGSPIADLLAVDNGNAEGLRFTGVATVDGVIESTVVLKINETTMATMPYSGELGSVTDLAYDWQITRTYKQVVLRGPFRIEAGVVGANEAPSSRPPSYGRSVASGSGGDWSTATLTFSDDVTVVTLAGLDDLAPIVAKAQAAQTGAELALTKATTLAASLNGSVMLTLTDASSSYLKATMTAGSTIKPYVTEVVAIAPAPPSGDVGVLLEIAGFNTGDPRQVIREDGTQIEADAWDGGQRLVLYYDGLRFRLVSPAKGGDVSAVGGSVLLTQIDAHPTYLRTTTAPGVIIEPVVTDLVMIAPTTRTSADGGVILEIAGFNTGDPRQVLREDGTQIEATAWKARDRLELYYDGSKFRLVSPAKATVPVIPPATGPSEYQIIQQSHREGF